MWQGALHTRSRALSLLLSGAVLLDLEQTTLPGIAHLMVETMIISDQIRAEDRANVLRALLLKHRWVAVAEGCQGSRVICEPQVAREMGTLMATTLLLSHPNDEKEGFFPRNHSSSSMNSIVGNHHHNHTIDTCVPLMGEERIEMADPKANETECKEVRVTWRGLLLLFPHSGDNCWLAVTLGTHLWPSS